MNFFEDARAIVDFMKRYKYDKGYRWIGIGVDGTLEKMLLCFHYNKWSDTLTVQMSIEDKFQFNARFENVGKKYEDLPDIQNYLEARKLTLMKGVTVEDVEHIIVMAKLEGRT